MKMFLIAALTFVPVVAAAQADAGCDLANALFGALLKSSKPALPCPPSTATTSPVQPAISPSTAPTTTTSSDATSPGVLSRRGRSVDIPENLALLTSNIKSRLDTMDPLRANDILLLSMCQQEMRPLASMANVMDSGYDELKTKCEAETRGYLNEFQTRRVAAHEKQRKEQIEVATRAEEQKKQGEAAEEKAAVAELRSGKRQPVDCPQWMVVKGRDLKDLNARVTEVSYQPPRGTGSFSGRVEQINGDTMLLSDQPIIRIRGATQGYMAIKIDRQAQLFNADKIKVNSVVEGYATQVGTRTLRLTNGAANPAPELLVSCMHVVM